MKAIMQDVYGPVDGLELRDINEPHIGDEEVLVRVRAAGVDRGVWHRMAGLPYPIRLAGFGFRAPKTPVAGMDMAGVVESTGKLVMRFQPGDEVFGIGNGSFAEFVSASENKLAPKPSNLSFQQAAVVPISGLTALQALRDKGGILPGDKVLIIGASGGVGTFAVQIAKSFGAHVTGVCSTSKLELVRSIGADEVVDYSTEDFSRRGERYDLIIDIGGNSSLSRLRHALMPKGRLVIAGGETDGRWLGGFDRNIRAILMSPFVGQKLGVVLCSENHEDLLALKSLIESGKVLPVTDRVFPLAEAPQAIDYVLEGRARGKVAISV